MNSGSSVKYRIDFGLLPWESPMKGVRCKMVKQEGRQVRLVEYSREMKPHWCERGHFGCILEGQFEITFVDSTQIFQAGDGVFIPSGREHRHMGRAVSDSVRALFIEDASPAEP